MIKLKKKFIKNINGLNYFYLESGKINKIKSNVILFLHGFPELSYSYRYLLKNFSNEGYYCIAPDQRGYGKTLGGSKKFEDNIEDYNLYNLTFDIVSFLQNLDIQKIDLLVGHDAGSIIAGTCALLREDIFNSIVMMSAPYTGVPKLSKQIFDDLIQNGRRTKDIKPYMGLSSQINSGKISVTRVNENGPAAKAGIMEKDIILSINNKKIKDMEDFYKTVWSSGGPGSKLNFEIERSQKKINLEIITMDRNDFYLKPKYY